MNTSKKALSDIEEEYICHRIDVLLDRVHLKIADKMEEYDRLLSEESTESVEFELSDLAAILRSLEQGYLALEDFSYNIEQSGLRHLTDMLVIINDPVL